MGALPTLYAAVSPDVNGCDYIGPLQWMGMRGTPGKVKSNSDSYDEALALPTEQAARIALRTQQIVAYESGVPQTVDPLAGSYYIESLTNEIETRANAYLEKIGAFGEESQGVH